MSELIPHDYDPYAPLGKIDSKIDTLIANGIRLQASLDAINARIGVATAALEANVRPKSKG